MSPFLQVLLSLFGAALLGNIIGWCARRIVAVRDEKMLAERHMREITEVRKDLAAEREETAVLNHRLATLEIEVRDNDLLNQTIAASEKEIQALRAESRNLQQAVAEKADRVEILEKESRHLAAVAARPQVPVSDVVVKTVQTGEVRQAPAGQAPTKRDIDLQRYALGSVASGSADLEVDDDITDLTSDLSAVLTPELQQELGDEAGVHTPLPAPPGRASGEGLFSRFNRKKKS